ncbi:hypothetical protein SDC9_185403 [bioreactor metagenome]|uniref:Uncharacterized protein n=1 Tax=bioreactor metagenome TaxID=1076179 RepID=A0A645HHL7_9ZZZZ
MGVAGHPVGHRAGEGDQQHDTRRNGRVCKVLADAAK